MTPQMALSQHLESQILNIIYLVRHGETNYNIGQDKGTDRIRGWVDVPLNKKGLAQSKQIAKKFTNVPLDIIYSSDLKRASEMANIVGKQEDVPVAITTYLRPWNLGKLQGQESGPLKKILLQYAKIRPDYQIEGGESFNNFKNRYLWFLKQIIYQAMQGKKILVVSHYRNLKLTAAWAKTNGKGLDFSVLREDSLEPADVEKLIIYKNGSLGMK